MSRLKRRFARTLRKQIRRRTVPGTTPGAVVADPNAMPSQIAVISYGSKEFEELANVSLDQVATLIGSHPVTWVNVTGLGDADVINRIGEIFRVHRLVLEDIVNVHQRAKVEDYDGQLFVVARMVSLLNGTSDGESTSGPKRIDNEQISLLIGDNYVITFQERVGDCLEPVRERIRKPAGRIRQAGADYLAYALLDAIVDGYFPTLEYFGDELDLVEDRLQQDHSRDTIHHIHQLRSSLLLLRRAAWPHREAMSALMREGVPHITDETRVYLRDCYDHTVQVIDITETYRELCADLRDLQFSQISLRQNEVMKVLTVTASIFIPLSFIAGLYGMNFDTEVSAWNMPELASPYGYPAVVGFMITLACGLLYYFRRRGWIGELP